MIAPLALPAVASDAYTWPITLGSAFSGIDGMAWGFERTGLFRTRWQIEKIAWRRELLSKRFPHSQIFEDVKNVGEQNLKPVHVICGGFPCQDISSAGKREGLSGQRSGLWYEFARIISELRPAIVFLENADEITAPIRERNTGRLLDRAPGFAVLASLADMGFDAEWGVVPASAVGAPHTRKRWWCIAWNVSNANRFRQSKSDAIEEHSHHEEREFTAQVRQQDIVHAPVSDDSGVALGDTHEIDGEAQREVWQQSALTRFSSHESQRANHRAGQANYNQSDMGGISTDGFSRRMERYARSELWAAPFGAKPYAYEPPRLTYDTYDWTARVEAIGDSVCVPLVSVFAEQIAEMYKLLMGGAL